MSNLKISRNVMAVTALGILVITVAAVLPSSQLSASNAVKSLAGPISNQKLPASFSEIIERVGPAVVSIRVTGKGPKASNEQPEVPDFFKRFFGEDFGFRFSHPREGAPNVTPRTRGMGSGFFIDAEGHVVTNDHVIGDADKIEVTTKDGSTYQAILVGTDPKTDLALLKVSAGRVFPFVTFGKSSEANVGDWVVALGSPFGLGHTATTGIVSARGRDIGAGPYDDFLQIDAPINKGNSGGPTFNVRGEVIGVNTAIISPTGVSAGIGFAVPSDMAKSVITQLKDSGVVRRGWLGVNIQQVTRDLAVGLGMNKIEGALISSVTEGSPAATADLRAGDVIVAVNGDRIRKMRDLPRRVARLRAGERAEFRILRGGQERGVDVVIGKMSNDGKLASLGPDKSTSPQFGVTLAKIDDRMRARFRLKGNVNGVVIVSVRPGGAAAAKGLRPGDIILTVAGQEVSAPEDVSRHLARAAASVSKSKSKAILILVNRRGSDRYVALPLPRA